MCCTVNNGYKFDSIKTLVRLEKLVILSNFCLIPFERDIRLFLTTSLINLSAECEESKPVLISINSKPYFLTGTVTMLLILLCSCTDLFRDSEPALGYEYHENCSGKNF